MQADRKSIYAQEGLSMIEVETRMVQWEKALSEEGLNGANNSKKDLGGMETSINLVKEIN